MQINVVIVVVVAAVVVVVVHLIIVVRVSSSFLLMLDWLEPWSLVGSVYLINIMGFYSGLNSWTEPEDPVYPLR